MAKAIRSPPSKHPHVVAAEGYVDDVLSGAVPAGKWVRLACARHRKDMARKGWDFRFDADKAERVCRFVELFPHVKGRWAAGSAKLLRLEPWQCFTSAIHVSRLRGSTVCQGSA